MVIALDGQPVSPHSPANGQVVIGPAMRVDLILDMTDRPGSRNAVIDRFYKGLEYQLTELTYAVAPLRSSPPDWPIESCRPTGFRSLQSKPPSGMRSYSTAA